MKRRVFLLTFLMLCLAATTGSGSFVSAQVGGTSEEVNALNKEIAARKETIKQLEETIEKYKKNISEKQTEVVSLRNQLSILDNRMAQINADIQLTEEKIKQTELEIQSLSLVIGEKEKSIAKQKKIIGQMVQSIHANDQKNYFEIMLTYDDFSAFYDELKYTESVYVDLGRSVKSLRLAKEDLDARKAEQEAKRKNLNDLRLQLEGKKNDLSQQIGAKSNLLIQTKSSESRYQTLLSSLRQQYQVIESEVRTFEDRVRKKLEEKDKIQESGSVDMNWPTPSHYINALFHDPGYPYRNVFEHSGIDIKASQGTPIRAAASGYVGRARRCSSSSCYAYVLLIHTGAISTVYGHLSSIEVDDDAFVNRGDIIGYSGGKPGTIGAGPFVTGPHLHFEVRLNGIPVNPLGYLAQ